jgi:hypothetical protein
MTPTAEKLLTTQKFLILFGFEVEIPYQRPKWIAPQQINHTNLILHRHSNDIIRISEINTSFVIITRVPSLNPFLDPDADFFTMPLHCLCLFPLATKQDEREPDLLKLEITIST